MKFQPDPSIDGKKRSLARGLTTTIIAVVVSVTGTTVALVSMSSARRAALELEKRADEYATSLSITLSSRLWNVDLPGLEEEGKAYLQNELVERFKVYDSRGATLVELSRVSGFPLVLRKRDITHEGFLLGTIEIGLTSRLAEEATRNLVISGVIAIVANTLVLVMATGFIFRRFLNAPLEQLNQRVISYSLDHPLPDRTRIAFIEFQPLVDVLDQMAERISSQIEALRSAESKYRGLFENAAEGIYQTTADGRFVSANPALARILGYDSSSEMVREVTGISHQLYAEPGDREAYIERLKKDGEVVGFEVQLLRKDGTPIWALASSKAVMNSKGQLVMIEGFLEDITERKRSRDALFAANDSLQRAHADLELRVLERTQELDESNRSLVREIQERKNAEREVAERNQELEAINTELRNTQIRLLQAQKLEAIGQLAAGIAHEINTPIQFIGDNTRFLGESLSTLSAAIDQYQEALALASEGILPSRDLLAKLREEHDLDYLLPELPESVKDTLDGIRRVASIVLALKEFSHPDSREKTMSDINAIIQNTIIVCRSEWKHVADLELQLEKELPLIPCLPGDLSQVLMNLIVNAAHAIQERNGGGERKGLIHVSTTFKEGEVCIRIADTGVGIRPEHLHRIFDPFFTTKAVGLGTGQGLAISRNIIVDKHGGRIEVESVVDQGSIFVLHLPTKPI